MRLPVCIAVFALVAAAASHASGPDSKPKPPRFGVSASLEATPSAVGDSRFRLQASLAPRKPQVSMESVGFVLKATLQPNGSGPICYGPGHIFADGFETPES